MKVWYSNHNLDKENKHINNNNGHSSSFWKQMSTNSDFWATDYSKRVKSKYLLNYYSKINKEKRQANKSYISEDIYSFVHRGKNEFKPKVSYKRLMDVMFKEFQTN